MFAKQQMTMMDMQEYIFRSVFADVVGQLSPGQVDLLLRQILQVIQVRNAKGIFELKSLDQIEIETVP